MTDFQATVAKLRARVGDAIRLGVGAENPAEFTVGVMFQIMEQCEKNRQDCLRQADSHREQAKAAEYQASAMLGVYEVAWRVYDGFIKAEERSRERAEFEAMEKAKLAAEDAPSPPTEEPPKRRGRKPKEIE